MTTEAEAKTKWCPFVRLAHMNGGSFNRPSEWEHTCIGSRCMAWRTKHPRVEREDHSGARDVMIAEAVRTRRTMQRKGPPGSTGILYLETVGYCGLAGKPND